MLRKLQQLKLLRKYNQDTGCLQKKDKVDKDRNLVEMIYTMLKSIPDVM